MGYRQLAQKQRYQLLARLETGASQRQIARELGIHSSTISREIRRNAVCYGYDPEQAQVLSDQRRQLIRLGFTQWRDLSAPESPFSCL